MVSDVNPRVLSSSSLMGDKVINSQGQDLGKIEDFMINLSSGCVEYAVLSFGGFLGMGDKLFAIPWKAMRLDTDRHAFILDVPKEKLENAPGFDKNNWPDMADPTWSKDINTYYGY